MARTESAEAPLPRRWALWLLLAVQLLGIAIGVYMTWHHDAMLYGGGQVEIVGCAETRVVNCDAVNASSYSEVLGVPIATFTGPTYGLVALLLLGVLLRRGEPRRLLAYTFGIGVAAFAYSVFLGLVSVFVLHHLCLWCLRLYAVNLSIALLSWLAARERPDRLLRLALGDLLRWPREARWAALAFLALCLLSFGGERLWRAHLLSGSPSLEGLSEQGAEAPAEPDPEGDCPSRSWTVKLEDGDTGELVIGPGDAWRGNPDAEVAAVIFGDLACPYCKRLEQALDQLYPHYRDRVLFVYKHYPMNPRCNPGVRHTLHPEACDAQRAAACAAEQGAFWRFTALAYKNNHDLGREALERLAERAGLDVERWRACFKGPTGLEPVFRNAREGMALHLHAVPRLYINGRRYVGGYSAPAVARVLERALGASEEEARAHALELAPERDFGELPEDLPEMVEVRRGDLHFFIDTFEASIEDGRAVSAPGRVPAHRVSWYEARAACEAAGKRLCSEQEWVTACQGAAAVDDDGDGAFADDLLEGTAYPYGDAYLPGACWTDPRRRDERPVYTGSMPGCRSADGVYDLVGNEEEWVGLDADSAVLLGGAYDTRGDHARCYRRDDTFGPGFKHLHTGFRCCRDAP